MTEEVNRHRQNAQMAPGPAAESIRRRRPLCAAILLGVIFIRSAAGRAQDRVSFDYERGTVGVVVIAKAGIAIAADSRSTHADGTYDDNAQKVFRVTDKFACTLAGGVAAREVFAFMARGFDFPALLRARASSPRLPYSRWQSNGQAGELAQELTDNLGNISGLMASEYDDGGTIAWLLTAGYEDPMIDEKRPGIEAHKIGLNVSIAARNGGASLMPADPVEAHSYKARHWDTAKFSMIFNGNAQVIHAILGGDPRFEPSRHVPGIERYFELRNQGKLDSITLDEEVKLAEALIGETIRIAGAQFGVGGQIDIATMTPSAAFQWVTGHDPKSKSELHGPLQQKTLVLEGKPDAQSGFWQTDRSIVIKRIRAKINAAPPSCLLNAVLEVWTRLDHKKLPLVSGEVDSGPVELGVPGPDSVNVHLATTTEGCSTPPAGATVTLEYYSQ
jgi:hypothetical protein